MSDARKPGAKSFLPRLSSQRQFVQFGAGFAPRWVMLIKQGDEAVAVGGFDQVRHFMNDDVIQQILRFLHEFCVQTNVAIAMIARAPLCLHSLKKISVDFDVQPRLPFFDERWHCFVKE